MTPEPLTRAEIIEIYESRGPVSESVAVYGWDRIVTTLVMCNVLRNKMAEMKVELDRLIALTAPKQ